MTGGFPPKISISDNVSLEPDGVTAILPKDTFRSLFTRAASRQWFCKDPRVCVVSLRASYLHERRKEPRAFHIEESEHMIEPGKNVEESCLVPVFNSHASSSYSGAIHISWHKHVRSTDTISSHSFPNHKYRCLLVPSDSEDHVARPSVSRNHTEESP